jgi:hypothetical protein
LSVEAPMSASCPPRSSPDRCAADARDVIIGLLVLLGFVSVPLAGGRLSALSELRLKGVPVVVGAFAVQILIVNVLPGGSESLHAAIHVASYGVLGIVMASNLDIPGMWLVALGGALNTTAIAANHGVMPASEGALRFAGMTPDPAGFTNSSVVQHAGFLGDIMAVPAWVPAANVFSVGDLFLIAGAWVLLHGVCRAQSSSTSSVDQPKPRAARPLPVIGS